MSVCTNTLMPALLLPSHSHRKLSCSIFSDHVCYNANYTKYLSLPNNEEFAIYIININ